MWKSYRDEVWKDIEFDGTIAEKEKFKISNYGRLLNCKGEEEFLVKEHFINGYRTLPLKQVNGKSTSRYVHKLVAQHFLEREHAQNFVLHLNYSKTDNHVENLKWATKKEKEDHHLENPIFDGVNNRITNNKLTEDRVRMIKRKLNDPNRTTRMKMIAKQFGISDMQLYRIKSGENWGHVKVE